MFKVTQSGGTQTVEFAVPATGIAYIFKVHNDPARARKVLALSARAVQGFSVHAPYGNRCLSAAFDMADSVENLSHYELMAREANEVLKNLTGLDLENSENCNTIDGMI